MLLTNTLPRMSPPTLNDLQQQQHEKASLVFVPAQSPSGLAFVACVLSAVDLRVNWPITALNRTQRNPDKTMAVRLPTRPETTKPRGPGNPLRGQERQTTQARGYDHNRIRLDMSTFLGHDM